MTGKRKAAYEELVKDNDDDNDDEDEELEEDDVGDEDEEEDDEMAGSDDGMDIESEGSLDDAVAAVEDVVDDLVFDVRNLTASNYHAVRVGNKKDIERILMDHTQRSVQLLINRIFACPVEKSDVGPLAVLPAEVSVIPREKRIPEAAPETKWERFAKEKGITKKKKERMIWDDDAKEFRPRYGYKRANSGVDELPIVEVKAGQDPYADPWATSREQKKARVNKNLKNQLKNQLRAMGGKSAGKLLWI
jgi:Ribosome biogenesis regulatory protein (RRS1)